MMQTLAALLTPTIAVIAIIIAYMQWRTAHQKTVLDLFDRRMAVYDKLRQSMRMINTAGKVSDESDRLFLEARSRLCFRRGHSSLFERSVAGLHPRPHDNS
ncbi:UNVERIFIED_ORG: hypothetical protein GGD51_002433 [Rhizobium esperanzae]